MKQCSSSQEGWRTVPGKFWMLMAIVRCEVWNCEVVSTIMLPKKKNRVIMYAGITTAAMYSCTKFSTCGRFCQFQTFGIYKLFLLCPQIKKWHQCLALEFHLNSACTLWILAESVLQGRSHANISSLAEHWCCEIHKSVYRHHLQFLPPAFTVC